jgi:hypothetical protein
VGVVVGACHRFARFPKLFYSAKVYKTAIANQPAKGTLERLTTCPGEA